jgi:hypothetical protein
VPPPVNITLFPFSYFLVGTINWSSGLEILISIIAVLQVVPVQLNTLAILTVLHNTFGTDNTLSVPIFMVLLVPVLIVMVVKLTVPILSVLPILITPVIHCQYQYL